MQRLIEVQYGEIGDEENIPTVDARDLWERLGVKTQFKDWIRRRLGETQLVEGQDFISLLKNEQRDIGAIVKKEYSLSMDAAKHIAMLERSDKGKQVRQYFITFEKKAKEELLKRAIVEEVKKIRASDVLADWLKAAQLLEVPKYYAQAEAVKATHTKTGIDYSPLLLKAPAQDNVPEAEMFLEVTEIGELLGFEGKGKRKGAEVNKFLGEQGFQAKKNSVWKATGAGKPHSQIHAWKSDKKTGFNLKWNVRFVRALREKDQAKKKEQVEEQAERKRIEEAQAEKAQAEKAQANSGVRQV